MRVAIPVLEGEVFGHFGAATAFLLADITEGQVLRQTVVPVPSGADHHGLPSFLKEQGATHVIAGGMGRPMLEHLTRAGLPAITGVTGHARDALAAFIAGRLESDPGAVHEHHHGQMH